MWKQVPPTDANLNSISLEYSYSDIQKASRNFSSSCLLGKGSYGAVYRGILKDGTEVAIKVLNTPKDSGFKEEVLVLSKFRHPNLVILMGFTRNDKDRYLLYELLPGGDLCSRLQRDAGFDWKKRLTCCLDAALGLSHLHNASPKVFHRDIKTQNILLDRNGTAKMADFGLALLVQPREGVRVEQCSGTLGYADPLYISSSVVTEKSEVYSFGMVLLEVLTGRPPALQGANGQIQYVYAHLRGDWRAAMSMVQWQAGWPPEMAQRIARLAVACIDKSEKNRPLFVDLVARLRDLLSRALTTSNSAPVNIFQPAPAGNFFPHHNQPPTPLVQNQMQLEEAFRRVAKKSVPQEAVSRWNPFALEDEGTESVQAQAEPLAGLPEPPVEPPIQPTVHTPACGDVVQPKKIADLPTPPTACGDVVQPKKIADLPTPSRPTLSTPSSMSGLIHKAVADFDEELRAMSRKEAENIDRAMHLLFPSNPTASSEEEIEEDQAGKREVAKHLLGAGFGVDQIREALKRASSVEAAVEWIVEQRWDT